MKEYLQSVGLYLKISALVSLKKWAKEKKEEGFIPTFELLIEELEESIK